MDDKEIRMRVIEAVMPQATRVGLTDANIVASVCEKLEYYVINGSNKIPPKRTTRTKKTNL